MVSPDLDQVHRKRLAPITKAWGETHELKVEDVFISERVLTELDQDKALLTSFREDRVLSLLPFVPALYVQICPRCIDEKAMPIFRRLTEARLLVPVLTSPYRDYPAPVIEIVAGADHVSFYEFDFYRWVSVMSASKVILCNHCVDERQKKLLDAARSLESQGVKSAYIRDAFRNLRPCIGSDSAYFDALERSIKLGQVDQIRRLYDLSWVICASRTASAFHAAQVVQDRAITEIPEGLTEVTDTARAAALALTNLVAAGLRLRIPTNIPIDQYVELVREYRPRILELSKGLLAQATVANEVSTRALLESITAINSEIERIKNLRRYLVLDALVGFSRNNPALVTGALVAGSLGIAAAMMVCAAGAAADATRRAGKLKLKTGEPERKLGRKVRRDLQPTINKLIAKYVGSSTTAMHVLSIRQEFEQAAGETQRQP